MRSVLKILSFVGLGLVIASPVLDLTGYLDTTQTISIRGIEVGTLLWFLTAPFWMGRKKKTGEQTQQPGQV